MVEIKTREFEPNEIREAVRIQIQELNQGFLSSFGDEALEVIFSHVAESRWGIFVLAVDAQQKRVLGYVFGTLGTGKLYTDFLCRKTFAAMKYFLPKMLSWVRIKKAFETLLYPFKKRDADARSPEAELLDLAVSRDYHGTGVAQMLFAGFVEECRRREISAFQIPTTETLNQAHRFYEKMGAVRAGTVEVHEGQNTFIYLYQIK